MAEASHMSRYHAAALSVTTIAAACGIYALYKAYGGSHPASSLHRSNAVHRPRRERHGVGIDRHPPTHDAPLGLIILRKGEDAYVINLATTMFPSDQELEQIFPTPIDDDVRQRVGEAAVELILLSCFNAYNDLEAWEQLAALGLNDLVSAMASRQGDQVQICGQRIPEILHMDAITNVQVSQALNRFLLSEKWAAAVHELDAPDPAETEDMDGTDGANKEPSHGLRGLLYYIAEEDAKRKAYEHRGIRCEECGEMPIRGVRYHCLNCPDYDLCASCEQHTEHVKTHVFAKIKIPLPVLSQPTKEYRLWYPGDPRKVHEPLEPALRKRLCQEHEYDEPAIDALYDQFICNANVPYPHDKTSIRAAIDRRAFNRALTRETWTRCFAANAIYDRMFAFYDTDMNGVIDFEELVSGVAYLRGPKRFATLERALQGYDIDGNGFIDRADFLRLLRAKYEIQQQLVSDMVEGQEVEQTHAAMETLQSSQPISSVFSQEDIPLGESRPRRGKRQNAVGDMEPVEAVRTILEDDDPWPSRDGSQPTISQHSISRFEEMIYGAFDRPSADRLSSDDIDQIDGIAARSADDGNNAVNGQDHDTESDSYDSDEPDEPHVPDIIWQAVEDGLNELLDKIFKMQEDYDKKVEESRTSRQKWKNRIAAAKKEEERRSQEEVAAKTTDDPLVATAMNAKLSGPKAKMPPQQNGEHRLRRHMVPTDRMSLERREQEISDASLDELLDSTGFSVRDNGSTRVQTSPRAAHIGASSIWNGSRANIATSPLRTVTVSDNDDYVDPTLPQHRPNAVVDITNTSNKKTTPPVLPERPPSTAELLSLAMLDDADVKLQERGGPGRLTFSELEAIAVTDKSGELRGLMKSWLEYASF